MRQLLSIEDFHDAQVPLISLHPTTEGMAALIKAEHRVKNRLLTQAFSQAQPNQLNTPNTIVGNFEGLPTIQVEDSETVVNAANPITSAKYIFPVHQNSLPANIQRRFGFKVGGAGCESIHAHLDANGNGVPRNVKFSMGEYAVLEIVTLARPIVEGPVGINKKRFVNEQELLEQGVVQIQSFDEKLGCDVWHTLIGNKRQVIREMVKIEGTPREVVMDFCGSPHAFRILGAGSIWAESAHPLDTHENQGVGITGQSLFFEAECSPRPANITEIAEETFPRINGLPETLTQKIVIRGAASVYAALTLMSLAAFPISLLSPSEESIYLKKHSNVALVHAEDKENATGITLPQDLCDLIKANSSLLKSPTTIAAIFGTQPRLENGIIPDNEIIGEYLYRHQVSVDVYHGTETSTTTNIVPITYSTFSHDMDHLASRMKTKDIQITPIAAQKARAHG